MDSTSELYVYTYNFYISKQICEANYRSSSTGICKLMVLDWRYMVSQFEMRHWSALSHAWWKTVLLKRQDDVFQFKKSGSLVKINIPTWLRCFIIINVGLTERIGCWWMWRYYWRHMHLKLCLQAISGPINQCRKSNLKWKRTEREVAHQVRHSQLSRPNQGDLFSFGQAWREHEEAELSSHLLIPLTWLRIFFFEGLDLIWRLI